MKLGAVTKTDKRNKTTSKKSYDDFMYENCEIIAIFPIYGQIGAIQKPDSGRIVCLSLTVTFYLTKSANRTKKCLIHLSHYCFE